MPQRQLSKQNSPVLGCGLFWAIFFFCTKLCCFWIFYSLYLWKDYCCTWGVACSLISVLREISCLLRGLNNRPFTNGWDGSPLIIMTVRFELCVCTENGCPAQSCRFCCWMVCKIVCRLALFCLFSCTFCKSLQPLQTYSSPGTGLLTGLQDFHRQEVVWLLPGLIQVCDRFEVPFAYCVPSLGVNLQPVCLCGCLVHRVQRKPHLWLVCEGICVGIAELLHVPTFHSASHCRSCICLGFEYVYLSSNSFFLECTL